MTTNELRRDHILTGLRVLMAEVKSLPVEALSPDHRHSLLAYLRTGETTLCAASGPVYLGKRDGESRTRWKEQGRRLQEARKKRLDEPNKPSSALDGVNFLDVRSMFYLYIAHEDGAIPIEDEQAKFYSDRFDVSLDWLLLRDGSWNPEPPQPSPPSGQPAPSGSPPSHSGAPGQRAAIPEPDDITDAAAR